MKVTKNRQVTLELTESEIQWLATLTKMDNRLQTELRIWLDSQTITSENIGSVRRQCLMPWDSSWNSLVREETAARENKPKPACGCGDMDCIKCHT